MSTSAAQEKGAASGEYSILDSIIAETRLTPDDEAYDIAKRGVSAFIEELLKPQNNGEPVKKAMVDRMIAEIDAKLSRQMDEILHHPDFQALESSWRGLQLLVDRTNFRENIKIEILNVSKEDLLDDFEDSPEVMQSGLYKHIYTAEYGQFGGQPVGDHRQLLHVPKLAGRETDAVRVQRSLHVPRAVHRRCRPEILRSGKLHRPAGSERSERPLRRPAIRQMAELPYFGRLPLRWPDRAAFPAA